jgi:hypothetical protein
VSADCDPLLQTAEGGLNREISENRYQIKYCIT